MPLLFPFAAVQDFGDRLLGFLPDGARGWVVQVFVVVFAVLLANAVLGRLLVHLQEHLKKTKTVWDETFIEAVRAPLRLIIWIVGLAFAVQIVRDSTDAAIFQAVGPVRDIGVIATITWFLVRFVRRVQDRIIERAEKADRKYDRTTVDALGNLLRISIGITGCLAMLQTLGFSISGVLAFGGIGGIAVGFAAKDLLANFFGAVMIYLDRPFEVGDWIRSPDRNIEGTVEKIGWRLTCIRTFDKRPLYVPNATFTTISVENPSRMQNRRIYETLGLRYDDFGKVQSIVDGVREMLIAHEAIDESQTLMVQLNAFGASSLDFFVYCFTHTTSWTEFHEIKQEILLRIGDIVEEHGAEIAFPTRTVHLSGELPEPVEPKAS